MNSENEARLQFARQDIFKIGRQQQNERLFGITCFTASNNYFVCGFLDGLVMIYDAKTFNPIVEPQLRFKMRVSGLSFNQTGDILLISSVDNNMKLYDMNLKQVKSFTHPNPITSCAIDPKSQGEQNLNFSCVFSDSQSQVLRLKPQTGFLSRSKSNEATAICKADQDVDTVFWKNDIIAWASLKSFYIYSATKNELIIQVTPSTSYYQLQFPRASFVILNDDQIRINFGGALYDFSLSQKQPKLIAQRKDIVVMTKANGITMKLIQYQDRGQALARIDVEMDGGESFSSNLPNDAKYEASKYANLTSSNMGIYLALPENVYKISLLDNYQRVQHYIELGNISKCLSLFDELTLASDHKSQLLILIIEKLLKNNENQQAIDVIHKYANPSDWEKIIRYFQQINQLPTLASVIPLEQLNLPAKLNTDILIMLMDKDPKRFCDLFAILPADKYISNDLIGKVERMADKVFEMKIPLMTLLHQNHQHEKAFNTAIALKYKGIFADIEKYNQYRYLRENFSVVLKNYGEEFAAFLVEHMNDPDLKPDDVISQIKREMNSYQRQYEINPSNEDQKQFVEKFLFNYLKELNKSNHPILKDKEVATELALQFIKFKDPDTMKFLTNSANLKVVAVTEAAVKCGMYREAAYLCKLSGDSARGMNIHLEQIRDPEEAIQYAKECDDKQTWKLLSQYSYKNRDFLRTVLLQLPGLHINPIKFISNIPDEIVPEDFETLASNTVKDYKRKQRTAQLAQDIVAKDAFGVFSRSFQKYMRGTPTQF